MSTSSTPYGGEPAAPALVAAMDGAERSLLLAHLAQAHPDAVEAGIDWLARWRAEAAERRRKAARRHEHDRRRRRRLISSRPA